MSRRKVSYVLILWPRSRRRAGWLACGIIVLTFVCAFPDTIAGQMASLRGQPTADPNKPPRQPRPKRLVKKGEDEDSDLESGTDEEDDDEDSETDTDTDSDGE